MFNKIAKSVIIVGLIASLSGCIVYTERPADDYYYGRHGQSSWCPYHKRYECPYNSGQYQKQNQTIEQINSSLDRMIQVVDRDRFMVYNR